MNVSNTAAGVCRCSANGMYTGKPQGTNLAQTPAAQFADWLSLALTGQMQDSLSTQALAPVRSYTGASYGNPFPMGTLYGSSLKNLLLLSVLSGGMQTSSLTLPGLLRYSALSGYAR